MLQHSTIIAECYSLQLLFTIWALETLNSFLCSYYLDRKRKEGDEGMWNIRLGGGRGNYVNVTITKILTGRTMAQYVVAQTGKLIRRRMSCQGLRFQNYTTRQQRSLHVTVKEFFQISIIQYTYMQIQYRDMQMYTNVKYRYVYIQHVMCRYANENAITPKRYPKDTGTSSYDMCTEKKNQKMHRMPQDLFDHC